MSFNPISKASTLGSSICGESLKAAPRTCAAHTETLAGHLAASYTTWPTVVDTPLMCTKSFFSPM